MSENIYKVQVVFSEDGVTKQNCIVSGRASASDDELLSRVRRYVYGKGSNVKLKLHKRINIEKIGIANAKV